MTTYEESINTRLRLSRVPDEVREKVVAKAAQDLGTIGLKERDWKGPSNAPEVSGIRDELMFKIVRNIALKELEAAGLKNHVSYDILNY